MGKTLDVREIVPKERHPAIMAAFSGLAGGESFVLVNDHEPRPLLYQFQTEHDGEFDWWPLEQGPERWRVTIAKRKTFEPKRTVTEYLQTDHSRLDAIFNGFLASVKIGRWDSVTEAFGEFNFGLRRHIKIEEEILFPKFEEKTGMTDRGPTFVMKEEHKEIKAALDRILSAIAAEDGKEAFGAANYLASVLSNHNMKEEHILYPESDAFLTEAERASVVKKAQAV